MSKKKKRRGAGGGQAFERMVSTKLSQWWKPGRDDIFWRATTSGARATVRSRRGKATFGQSGDIAALDPIGLPLLDLLAIECKKGYRAYTAADLLDRKVHAGPQVFEDWVSQAQASHKVAGSFAWCIIHNRGGRERDPAIYFPKYLFNAFREEGCFKQQPNPYFYFNVTVREFTPAEKVPKKDRGKRKPRPRRVIGSKTEQIVGMTLDTFLGGISPMLVREMVKRC